jgi:hypothetical protein
MAEVLYANGHKSDAAAAAERLEKNYGKNNPFFVAQNYAYVNDTERAIEWLHSSARLPSVPRAASRQKVVVQLQGAD